MNALQQKHCEHECICMKYANTNAYGYPCTHNGAPASFIVNSPCEHDTRQQLTVARIDFLKEEQINAIKSEASSKAQEELLDKAIKAIERQVRVASSFNAKGLSLAVDILESLRPHIEQRKKKYYVALHPSGEIGRVDAPDPRTHEISWRSDQR